MNASLKVILALIRAASVTMALLGLISVRGAVWAATLECFPWDEPGTTTLRKSPHKVFAHYFSPFPISIDNLPDSQDYYTREYLSPDGERGKHASYGGRLRDRPLPRAPFAAGVDFQLEDLKTDVRRAIRIGLDGFTFDVLDLTVGSSPRGALQKLLAAAKVVDPAFKILLVPDMTARTFGNGGTEAGALAELNELAVAFGSHPSVFHLSDGRTVLSPFAAERQDAAFWIDVLTRLKSIGSSAALIPMPVGGWIGTASHFDGVPLYGASSWGTRTEAGAPALMTVTAQVHAQGLIWMAPVAPQDSRPRSLSFTEAHNSAAYRAQWDAAIAGDADWVQLITWNDYSENTQVAPSVQTGTAFYSLAGYYTAWFKLGRPPAIVRDGIYYFHRAQSMDSKVAPPDLSKQARVMTPGSVADTSIDEIELIALLISPATLEISIGGHVQQKTVDAGMQEFSVPLQQGTPVFRIVRDGRTVLELTSSTRIDNHIVYQDPLYHAGAKTICGPI